MARTRGARSTTGGTGARYRIWQTMRMWRHQGHSWTLREMAAVCETTVANVRSYIAGLLGVGYVRIRSHRPGLAGGDRRHELVLDTGPEAPRVRVDRSVWDANRQAELWPAGGEAPGDE